MPVSKNVRESVIETELVRQVHLRGGICDKVISPGSRGFFDRIVVLPPGRVIFVEVKRPKGGVVRRHQKLRASIYRAAGAEVVIVRRLKDIDELLNGSA